MSSVSAQTEFLYRRNEYFAAKKKQKLSGFCFESALILVPRSPNCWGGVLSGRIASSGQAVLFEHIVKKGNKIHVLACCHSADFLLNLYYAINACNCSLQQIIVNLSKTSIKTTLNYKYFPLFVFFMP